jgi:hypothetical protein
MQPRQKYLLVSFALPWLTYAVLGWTCNTMIYSHFFRFDLQQHRRIEASRMSKAQANILSLQEEGWKQTSPPIEAKICMGMLVSNRTQRYSVVAFAAILMQLQDKKLSNLYHFFIADTQPLDLPNSDVESFARFVPVIRIGSKNYYSNQKNSVFAWREKEAHDYTEAMNYCVNQNLPYTILLEEDALAGKDALRQIIELLRRPELKLLSSWLVVKLYRTDQFEGWNLDRPIQDPLTILALAVLVALVLERVVTVLTYRRLLVSWSKYGFV